MTELGFTIEADTRTAVAVQLRKREEIARQKRVNPRGWADAYESREELFLTDVAHEMGLTVSFAGNVATFT